MSDYSAESYLCKTCINFKALAVVLLCTMPSISVAQTIPFPSRPITAIVPLQAGSAGDSIVRIVAKRMAEEMGQPIVIDNKPGVSGAIGAMDLARAAPDGYTIGGMSDSVVNYAPNLVKVNFDPLKDFEPISLISDVSWVLVVNPKIPVKSVNELIAWIKKQPGSVDFSSAGVGSPHQVVMELFNSATGISTTHIPYKGATAALIDVVGGTVPMMFSGLSVALPFIQDGKLRALAVPGKQRSPLLPEVPTMVEAGVSDFIFSTWIGLYAPKGTPISMLNTLNAAAENALQDSKVREQLINMGSNPEYTSRDELKNITAKGFETVAGVVKSAGITTNKR